MRRAGKYLYNLFDRTSTTNQSVDQRIDSRTRAPAIRRDSAG